MHHNNYITINKYFAVYTHTHTHTHTHARACAHKSQLKIIKVIISIFIEITQSVKLKIGNKDLKNNTCHKNLCSNIFLKFVI